MARMPRIWFPGAWYHIYARGNNKSVIFFEKSDYHKYLELLQKALIRYECRLHAYALMPNHIHLMIETGQHYSISKPMQWLHASYTAYINFVRERVGHLFQGRYGSVVVEQDAYALELSRYIHLNPARAGLVSDPVTYPWSSLHAYLYPELEQNLISTQWVLESFKRGTGTAGASYRQFVLEGLHKPDTIEPLVRFGCFLSSKTFARVALERAGVRAFALTPIVSKNGT